MLESYSGATTIVPLIGHPVAQNKSPFAMTRAFAERGYAAHDRFAWVKLVEPLD